MDGIPESSNRFFVCLKHLDVVHVALPIFHVACMVPRYHPALIVRPYHCPNRAVVCLNREINFSRQSANDDKNCFLKVYIWIKISTEYDYLATLNKKLYSIYFREIISQLFSIYLFNQIKIFYILRNI